MINKLKKIVSVAIFSIACIVMCPSVSNAQSTITQTNVINVSGGPYYDTANCPGSYEGYMTITNPANNTLTFTVPTGATNVVFSDISGYSYPYNSRVYISDLSNLSHYCSSNSISHALVSTHKYRFVLYVKATNPTNLTSVKVAGKIDWQ